MKTRYMVAAIALMAGIGLYASRRTVVSVVSVVTPCPAEIEYQVYDKLKETLQGYNSVNAWIDKPSLEDLDKEQREINRIRVWLQTAQLDSCVRGQYNEWLDYYYQHGLEEAYGEVKNHAESRHMDEYTKQTDELFGKVRELEKTSPIPGPPQR